MNNGMNEAVEVPLRCDIRRILLPALGLLLCTIPSFAAEDRHPLETADTSSPRATLESFNDAAKETYDYFQQGHVKYRSEEISPVIDRLFSCLDLSDVPPATRWYVASEAAVCLKEVLCRAFVPPPSKVFHIQSLESR